MNEDAIRLSFTANQIQQLKTNPLRTVIGRMSGRAFEARTLIPDYDQRKKKSIRTAWIRDLWTSVPGSDFLSH